MKHAILYSALTADANRQAVFAGHGDDRVTIFIRVVVVRNCADAGEALMLAKPREDEIVLNTIPLEP